MPLFFLGTREWRNRQTRTVQVRVPVMEWGFNSPLAHDETADPSGSAVFVFPGCGLWPRWCFGRRLCFVGPGCFVCPWVAARPRAVRAASFARRVGSKPGQAPPPPMGAAAWPCRPGVRLSETAIAFAHSCSCGIETPVAYAGAKWVFLVQCSGAEVMSVSVVPCWGRAVVLLVSTSPCCRASCAKKFALLGLVWVRARKSSPCTLKTPQNRRFFACWASFFAEMQLEGPCWASFFAPIGPAPFLDAVWCTSGWLRWGFCSIRSWLAACRRRVVPLMTPFPPFGGGPAEPPPGGLTCA